MQQHQIGETIDGEDSNNPYERRPQLQEGRSMLHEEKVQDGASELWEVDDVSYDIQVDAPLCPSSEHLYIIWVKPDQREELDRHERTETADRERGCISGEGEAPAKERSEEGEQLMHEGDGDVLVRQPNKSANWSGGDVIFIGNLLRCLRHHVGLEIPVVPCQCQGKAASHGDQRWSVWDVDCPVLH
eukprot:CAMPEP_0206438764 /NCGR_PEP_ID=MMETSP0324_2-20121206/11826_1 /ASSEMBLY_ACC=CAM_ASM_000836 /TAXON_ID=2866 /ORGANISM="Crypthecodinium cohnii, Strain Seligo" /LENGTH=186 /DNA_ID=CAMNT_0053906289 /DNA_START=124 /DNA_END=684 /DNA_ORIENTATION=-